MNFEDLAEEIARRGMAEQPRRKSKKQLHHKALRSIKLKSYDDLVPTLQQAMQLVGNEINGAGDPDLDVLQEVLTTALQAVMDSAALEAEDEGITQDAAEGVLHVSKSVDYDPLFGGFVARPRRGPSTAERVKSFLNVDRFWGGHIGKE